MGFLNAFLYHGQCTADEKDRRTKEEDDRSEKAVGMAGCGTEVEKRPVKNEAH
jgi:hypothetical protein